MLPVTILKSYDFIWWIVNFNFSKIAGRKKLSFILFFASSFTYNFMIQGYKLDSLNKYEKLGK